MTWQNHGAMWCVTQRGSVGTHNIQGHRVGGCVHMQESRGHTYEVAKGADHDPPLGHGTWGCHPHSPLPPWWADKVLMSLCLRVVGLVALQEPQVGKAGTG